MKIDIVDFFVGKGINIKVGEGELSLGFEDGDVVTIKSIGKFSDTEDPDIMRATLVVTMERRQKDIIEL